MGASGWETRRRRQAERDREWEESIAAAAREEEKERLRPMLKRCLSVVSPQSQIAEDLRRELGRPEEG